MFMMRLLKFMLFVCCETFSDLCLECFRGTQFKVESGCGHMFRVEYLEGSQPGFTSTVYVYCGKWTRSGVRNMFWSRPTFAIHRFCDGRGDLRALS